PFTPQYIPEDCPPDLVEVAQYCLELDPNVRPDFHMISKRLAQATGEGDGSSSD
ncbi:hypothetical protein KIPB_013340, partial [Kipferlia bialata]